VADCRVRICGRWISLVRRGDCADCLPLEAEGDRDDAWGALLDLVLLVVPELAAARDRP